ncbi:hypothetical protein ABF228_002647 [Yersinia ruckeri]|nr:hypothetical protein [Yersinia ruckeri]
MNKLRVKVVTIGHLPASFNKQKLLKFDSSLFQLDENIDAYELNDNSDGGWMFSDKLMLNNLPEITDCDFIFAITTVPLELDWYSRPLSERVVACTFHEISGYLKEDNIPLENMVLRVIHAYALAYVKFNHKIPMPEYFFDFAHDETRGCIFDMNAYKADIVESCARPIICDKCTRSLLEGKIPRNIISSVKKDIFKIKKRLYYRVVDYIKVHPIISMILSGFFVVTLGVLGSLIASYLYDFFKTVN